MNARENGRTSGLTHAVLGTELEELLSGYWEEFTGDCAGMEPWNLLGLMEVSWIIGRILPGSRRDGRDGN